MKRPVLALAALLAAALAAAAAPVHAAAPVQAERYGIVRVDAYGTWTILSNAAHQPSGLTTVTCTLAGRLVVGFQPLGTIGTFVADEDESYAGRVDAGASVGLDRFVLTFRRPSTGAVVACNDPALRIANSNVQLLVVGTAPSLP